MNYQGSGIHSGEIGADVVLVVAASRAIDDYAQHFAYICRPGRTFREVGWMAFYTGEIEPIIPRVIAVFERVNFDEPGECERLAANSQAVVNSLRGVRRSLQLSPAAQSAARKVIVLSGPGSSDTIRLSRPIRNDLRTDVGRVRPFVQGHRYVPLSLLMQEPLTTTDLLQAMSNT